MSDITHKLNNKSLIDFTYAGKAILTMENMAVMKHYTYMIVEKAYDKGDGRGEQRCWWVSVFTGTENTNIKHYTFAGCLFPNRKFNLYDAKSKVEKVDGKDAQSVSGFKWLLKRMEAFSLGQITSIVNDPIQVLHAGFCGRCFKMLTVGDSIETGFGRVCEKNVSLGRERKRKIAMLTTTPKERKDFMHDVNESASSDEG